MKWFKHFVAAGDSVKLNKLVDELGVEGYGRYWLLLELLAGEFDGSSTTFEVHFRKISAKVQIKFSTKLETFLQKLSDFSLLTFKKNGKVYEINCPILMELQDKDSRYNRKRIVTKSQNTTLEEEVEEEVDKEKEEENRKKESISSTSSKKDFLKLVDVYNNQVAIPNKLPAQNFFLTGNQVNQLEILEGHPELQNFSAWEKYFQKIGASKFLTREKRPRVDFAWAIDPENVTKVFGGRYDNFQDQAESEIQKYASGMTEEERKLCGL